MIHARMAANRVDRQCRSMLETSQQTGRIKIQPRIGITQKKIISATTMSKIMGECSVLDGRLAYLP